jgi:hypothetical protein
VNNVCCYTAITARYDSLKSHPDIPGVDFVAFMDAPEDRDDWQVRQIGEFPDEHPRLTAKAYKLLPHIYLPEYEYNIWLDADFQITSETFPAEAVACIGQAGIAMWRHTRHDDIRGEHDESRWQAKYVNTQISEQVAHYIAEGIPEPSGVWCTGVQARKTHDPQVVRLLEIWMSENHRWSYQDQISFPYAVWKTGVVPDPLPPQWTATECPWFDLLPHNPNALVP